MRATLRKTFQQVKIPIHQGFLLGTGPAFQLPFGGNCVSDTVEFLMVHKCYWSPPFCVSAESTGIVLRDATLKISAR